MPKLIIRKDQSALRQKVLAGQRQMIHFRQETVPIFHLSPITVYAGGENKRRIRVSEGPCIRYVPLTFVFKKNGDIAVRDHKDKPVAPRELFRIAAENGYSSPDEMLQDARYHRYWSKPLLHAAIVYWKQPEAEQPEDIPELTDREQIQEAMAEIQESIDGLVRLKERVHLILLSVI
jgi:hypothetical protein